MERLFGNLGSVKQPKRLGALPLEPTRGAYSAPNEPPVAVANMLTHWVMTYGHKINPS